MKSKWKAYLLYASAIIVGGGLLYMLFVTVRAKNTGFEIKTLWDWMELLIIPLFLAGGAFFLNRSERYTEREIAKDRQQEAALQAYFDRMTELLLKNKLRTTENEEVRDVARTITLSVLRGLDGVRKGQVIQFLYEAKLLKREKAVNSEKSIVNLELADLRGADLSGAFLKDAQMRRVNLRGAKLIRTYLVGANLSLADFSYANLSYAAMGNASLTHAIMENTDLRGATLKNADMTEANLRGANLNAAILWDADLKDAIVNEEQLATIKSLKGAIMPDGTIHE